MPVQDTEIPVVKTSRDAGSLAVSVNAVIERVQQIVSVANSSESNVGDLSGLQTEVKTNLVEAINEIVEKFSSGEIVASYIGQLSDLNTTSKTNVVSALNEVNLKVGDIGDLTVEQPSSIVDAINKINTIVEGLDTFDSGSIIAEIGAKINRSGDSMTGALNILAGVEGADTVLLGLGNLGLQPSWKVILEGNSTLSINKYDPTNSLLTGKRFALSDAGNLTVGGSITAGFDGARFETDGDVIGTAWETFGGNVNAIAAITNKLDERLGKSGGTLTGQISYSLGNFGILQTVDVFKFSDKTYKSWDRTIGASSELLFRSFNPDTGVIVSEAVKVAQNGNTEVAGTFKSAGPVTAGSAVFGTDGSVAGTVWNTWAGSANAITAIENYLTDQLSSLTTFPSGGLANQVLAKNSGSDYDFKWAGPYADAVHNHTMANISDLAPALSAINTDISSIKEKNSIRDFVTGTLIDTGIVYTGSEPFLIEIKSNTNDLTAPLDLKIQGYMTGSDITNYSATSVGAAITGLVIFIRLNKLHVWFPRQGYWHGYSVYSRLVSANAVDKNYTISITDAAKPTTGVTAEKAITPLKAALVNGGPQYFEDNLFAGFTSGQGYVMLTKGGTTYPGYIGFYKPDGTRAGYAGFGNGTRLTLTSLPGAGYTGWYVAGDLYATGNITAYSDIRLKTEVEDLGSVLDSITKLRGVRYTVKESGVRRIGVIAQELREVFPELVTEDEDEEKLLSVSYGNITAVLIEAIKELKAEIDELKRTR